MSVDKENMLEVLRNFPLQCRESLGLARGLSVGGKISNIVIAGMGGSAIGGDLLKAVLKDAGIPVHVNRDYKVPSYVDENSLVFCVSYSGNTEETLSSYFDAFEKKAKIIAITTGGKLAEECEKVVEIPAGLQPRAAIGYLFFPMLGILHNSKIVSIKNSDLNEMFDILKDVDDFMEDAQSFAKKLDDKIPIIYSSETLAPVAMRWKTQINENAKLPAFWNVFSEMNHNEIAAFRGMDTNYKVIIIRDKFDNGRIKKRMDICKKIMEETVR